VALLVDLVVASLALLALALPDALVWLDESQAGGGGGANEACEVEEVEAVEDVELLADVRSVRNVVRSFASWLSSAPAVEEDDADELLEEVEAEVDEDEASDWRSAAMFLRSVSSVESSVLALEESDDELALLVLLALDTPGGGPGGGPPGGGPPPPGPWPPLDEPLEPSCARRDSSADDMLTALALLSDEDELLADEVEAAVVLVLVLDWLDALFWFARSSCRIWFC
jgi:hypothetical protein